MSDFLACFGVYFRAMGVVVFSPRGLSVFLTRRCGKCFFQRWEVTRVDKSGLVLGVFLVAHDDGHGSGGWTWKGDLKGKMVAELSGVIDVNIKVFMKWRRGSMDSYVKCRMDDF